MSTKQKLIQLLAALGLIFSSLLRINFNINTNFEFQQIWLRVLPFPIFDYADQSHDLYLSSTIIGYLFYVLSGFIMLKEIKTDRLLFPLISGFLILSSYAIYVETTSILQDMHSVYKGQYMRIGPTLFIVFLWVYSKYQKMIVNRIYTF